ncbi:MAG: hypothetical protein K2Y40_15325, partial [Reyranella sp.]|nr:hypothetical protein [Reyranella sp.]
MPTSSVAVRGFALALLGLGAAQASAQVPNVTAFNPYSGIGLPGGPVPQYGPQAAYPIVDTVGPGPAGGPAFNPWRPGAAGGPAPVYPTDQAPVFSYNPGAYLPPPPPGPIESRIVAIPERGDAATSRGRSAPAPDYVPPTPPMAAAPVAPRPEPAPTPPPAPAVVAPPPPAAA